MLPVDTTNLYYEDHGDGPPIVFLHGLGTSTQVWTAQLADLSADHRTIAYDWRGCGRSGRPREGNTIAGNAQDLLDVCAAFGLDAPVLVGSSMGAVFAFEAARRAPERVGGVVSIDGPGHWPATGMAEELPLLSAALAADRANAVTAWVPGWYAPSSGDALAAHTIRQMLDSGPFYGALFDDLVDYDPRPALAELPVPAAFVHGREDAAVPLAVARELAALTPGAELIVVDGAGHMPHQERPAAVNAALRTFVAGTRRGSAGRRTGAGTRG
jgi:non-heme chloroperoxidase